MDLKDLKIGAQLQLGFAAMLLFVIVLGVVAYRQNESIHQQTEIMYNHPLQVRGAIGKLQSDILSMRLATRDLILAEGDQEKQDAIQVMELSNVDALKQFDILNQCYLGPRSDLDEAYKAYISWKTARDKNTTLALSGEIDKVKRSVQPTGEVGTYRNRMLEKIKIIDDFAYYKAEALYANSNELNDKAVNHLLLIVAIILLLSFLFNYILLRNIRNPLTELIDVTHRFHNGELSARCLYQSQNEFGLLSDSFNNLAANIQLNMDLENKSAKITKAMLSEDDARLFFQVTLNVLAAHTDSQIGAVYLLSNDKKTFDHFESLGVDRNARQSFDAQNLEGEIGTVLASRKVKLLKNLPEDSRFVFNTVSGKYIPTEMITIPILSSNEIIAIISLASVNTYEHQSIQLIDYILDTLCARVEGVLAYRKIKDYSKKLEVKREQIAQAGVYNRALIEASIDPFVTIDKDGRITDVNNSAEAITGLAREKLIGTDFSRYFTDPEYAMAGFQQVFVDGFVRDYELSMRHIDGSITPVLYNASVYYDKGGHVLGVFAAARDITEQKRIEEKLNILNEDLTQRSDRLTVANRELESQKNELASQSDELTQQNTELEMQKKQLHEASRLKTSFLSNMSHELRTPLNSVIALSGVLSRRLGNKIPTEEFSYLEVIERNGKHLLELINDILDISRIEAGREEVEIVRFNVNSLIADLVNMIQPQARQKGIELIFAADGPGIIITNDAGKCRHILQNLIGNAVKFTDKGKVEISAHKSGKNISIKISDTGIGITDSQIQHIFDEFRQADSSTSRRFGGTGLGLAIAKKFANLLGGVITVTSVPDKGSEFTLELPLHYSGENIIIDETTITGFNHDIKEQSHQPAADIVGKTILLVEDSEPAIIQMKHILEANGYRLIVARDGSEALGILAKTIPDGIILDLMMPGIDGFEVLKSLREAESTSSIPVLILSAKHITKEELKFLKKNNVHQLIQKGDVNRIELLNAVGSMVWPKSTEEVQPKREWQTIEGKPLVLVVEDNPDNMLTVKALLSDSFIVIEAGDGLTAITMAANHKPNLILMDIDLPGMDGIEAFINIRKNVELNHVPVIALTASAMISDRETILAYGLDAYIAKPVNEKEFFKTINEVLYGK
jgi:PAS domain S-box-containing protein